VPSDFEVGCCGIVCDLHLTTDATNAIREDNAKTADLTRLIRRECLLESEAVLPIMRVQLEAVLGM
jgi:hypothetical protein